MRGDNFANPLPCSRSGVNSGSDRGDVTADDRRDQTSIDLFPANETNVGGLHHCVSRFDHRHQSATFNHSECFWHKLCPLCFVLGLTTNKVPSTKYKAQFRNE
jgi:hypothetical protein